MAHDTVRPQSNLPSRRDLVRTIGLAAGAALTVPRALSAQNPPQQVPPPQAPPSTVTNPPRDFGPGAPPTTYFNDPDIVVVDPMFSNLLQRNSAITRLWTGALWTE